MDLEQSEIDFQFYHLSSKFLNTNYNAGAFG